MRKNAGLYDRDFDGFKDRVYANGVLRLPPASWNEFHEVTRIFGEHGTDCIWRGHQDERWALKSLFDREFSRDNFLSHLSDRQHVLARLLERFKRRLEELSGANLGAMTDAEIWAIGQHYGLPTPLLDWTECPYIAAFMAFRKRATENQSGCRVVYALDTVLKRLLRKVKAKTKSAKTKNLVSSSTIRKDRFIEFLDLTKTSDDVQNLRLHRQKGRFTKALDGITIEAGISRLAEHCREISESKRIILAEILIPDIERTNCLKWLGGEKGITHGTLFPDYAGAVEICRNDLGLSEREHR